MLSVDVLGCLPYLFVCSLCAIYGRHVAVKVMCHESESYNGNARSITDGDPWG